MRAFLLAITGAALAACASVRAATYPLPPPDEDLIGELAHVFSAEEDTLVDIARRHRLGYEELALANPAVDRWLPGEGTAVLLPTRYILPAGPREGIVVNIAELRLYYYPKPVRGVPAVVETYAVSAGREDWKTPRGRMRIAQKLEKPAWYPPRSIREEHKADGRLLPAVVPPGPDNPLGPLAMKLSIPGGYFIHGTSKPFGIGMTVTHGCLRLYPEDMEALFKRVPVNTPVRVVDQPYKTGWKNGVLYVEAHPAADGTPANTGLTAIREPLALAVHGKPDYTIDWNWVESLALQPRGVPLPVPRQAEIRAHTAMPGRAG
jgi:L,D-transpeptidase ErfK/SrfK